MLSDVSSTSVMDHLSEIEKRRRVAMMRQREVDTRMAFALEDRKVIQKQGDAMNAEEAELRRDLDSLIQEQQHVQQQLMVSMDRVRRGEEEEALLQQCASQQLSTLEEGVARWRDKMHDLRSFHQLWESDSTMGTLHQNIRAAEEARQRAHAQKEALLTELADGEAKLTEMNELYARKLSALKRCNSSMGLPDSAGVGDMFVYSNEDDAVVESASMFVLARPHSVTAEANALSVLGLETVDTSVADSSACHGDAIAELTRREALEQVCQESAQSLAQQTRQNATLKREVDDLTARAEELARWLTGVLRDREEVEQKVEQLRQCAQRHLCAACLANDSIQG